METLYIPVLVGRNPFGIAKRKIIDLVLVR
jgi:hypothetical protein